MAAVKATVSASKDRALHELRCHVTSPLATMHILTATLRLLRRDPATFATWNRATRLFNDTLFADLEAYDAAQERDVAVWKGVRAAYKAGNNAGAWAYEMPETGFGALLMIFIKQVRCCMHACAAGAGLLCVGCCPQRGLLCATCNSALLSPRFRRSPAESREDTRPPGKRCLVCCLVGSCWVCWVCANVLCFPERRSAHHRQR